MRVLKGMRIRNSGMMVLSLLLGCLLRGGGKDSGSVWAVVTGAEGYA
ncbi:MAG: hypothetical protein LBU25_06905 [Treponema sp.]|nr:hypothetical protein [Treponema sp.]